MKTLLTGVVSAILLTVAGLFFFEHIPQARQIKQDHPTLVIISGVVLIIVGWQALNTILLVIGASLSPLPFYFIHAAARSSDGLIDSREMGGDYFVNTPLGQLMQIVGIEPRATVNE